ncbi:16291_t:CDS:2, partial [Rhizophagus irregularis]
MDYHRNNNEFFAALVRKFTQERLPERRPADYKRIEHLYTKSRLPGRIDFTDNHFTDNYLTDR